MTERALEQLLAAKEIVVTCGAGGVGKTTTAAALGAMAAVHLGGKVLVLTVDPARRLATAMGIGEFGNVEVRVPPAAFAGAGVELRGELWAAMLDTKQSWDALVLRHELGDTYAAAETLERLGQTYRALDQNSRAGTAWRQALRLYRTQRRTAAAERVECQLVLLKADAGTVDGSSWS